MRRWLAWSAVAVVLLIAAVAGGLAIHRRVTYGHIYGEDDRKITTSANTLFTLVLSDQGPSVGDHWTATVGDPSIVKQVRSKLVPDSITERLFGSDPGGGAGKRYVTFRAKAAGVTAIEMFNCFQGCRHPETRAYSRTVTWTVTVER